MGVYVCVCVPAVCACVCTCVRTRVCMHVHDHVCMCMLCACVREKYVHIMQSCVPCTCLYSKLTFPNYMSEISLPVCAYLEVLFFFSFD